MIPLLAELAAILSTLLTLTSGPAPDPEAVRGQLLRANRLISDELMRRGIV